MGTTSPEQNKRLVLQAFDILFNKRDYEAAEVFWSPTYIQHSAHIAPGRDGLFNLIRSLPATLISQWPPDVRCSIQLLTQFQPDSAPVTAPI